MALEATLMIETETAIPFTCADGTGIPKGSILKMNNDMTVVITSGDTDIVAGIAAEEKIANDGKTTLAVYMRGIFKGYAGAAGVAIGHALITDTATGAANEIVSADVDSENILGRCMETTADTEMFTFELHPFTVNLA